MNDDPRYDPTRDERSILIRCVLNTLDDAMGEEPEFDLDEGVVRKIKRTPTSISYGLYPTDDDGEPLPMPTETIRIVIEEN